MPSEATPTSTRGTVVSDASSPAGAPRRQRVRPWRRLVTLALLIALGTTAGVFTLDPVFDAKIAGPEFFDAAKYPEMTFVSTAVELTGANTADITGDFTLHGVTKPVVLSATFNGGYAGHPMDPHARIGFSAKGQIKRSDFGISAGIPAPGTTMGVSDEVEIIIEAEFNGPPLKEGAP